MARRIIIAGNWKMHKTPAETLRLLNGLKVRAVNITKVEMVVCPTFVSLTIAAEALKDSRIVLGAQNMFWETEGAYTGEISAPMLKDAGCTYVILGHSERRQYFGETDETVNKRMHRALAEGLKPIMCIGETLQEREDNRMFEVLERQVTGGLAGISAGQMADVVLAYEPVWAIGTGKTATPEQADEAHAYIRGLIAKAYGDTVASAIRIQYGGSVKPGNAAELLSKDNIDGALVGGASLDAESFIAIIKAAE